MASEKRTAYVWFMKCDGLGNPAGVWEPLGPFIDIPAFPMVGIMGGTREQGAVMALNDQALKGVPGNFLGKGYWYMFRTPERVACVGYYGRHITQKEPYVVTYTHNGLVQGVV